MKKNTTADSVFTFFLYNILGEVRPEKLYCACLWKYNNPDGTPAFEGLVNPKSDFDALRADGARPWVEAFIRTIEDMSKAAILGAELITSNEPKFMISDYNVFVGDDYGLGGNYESVYLSDFHFVCIDDYRKLGEVLAKWL